jgi:hypothetical protein
MGACLLPLAQDEVGACSRMKNGACSTAALRRCPRQTLDTRFDAQCRGATRRAQAAAAPGLERAPPLRIGETWRLLVALRAAGEHQSGRRGQHCAAPSAPPWLRACWLAAGPPARCRRPEDRPVARGYRRRDRSRRAERDAAALIAALAVGDTRRVSAEQWRVFNATGLTHLVAISGCT